MSVVFSHQTLNPLHNFHWLLRKEQLCTFYFQTWVCIVLSVWLSDMKVIHNFQFQMNNNPRGHHPLVPFMKPLVATGTAFPNRWFAMGIKTVQVRSLIHWLWNWFLHPQPRDCVEINPKKLIKLRAKFQIFVIFFLDGSDEMRCRLDGCEPNEFQCSNKKCVLKTWRCTLAEF